MCTLKQRINMSTGLYTITRILAYHKILMGLCVDLCDSDPVTCFYLWGKTPIMARWQITVDPRQRHKVRSRGSQYDVVSLLNQWDPLCRNFTGLSLSSKKQWVVNSTGCCGRHLLVVDDNEGWHGNNLSLHCSLPRGLQFLSFFTEFEVWHLWKTTVCAVQHLSPE